ncbi:MAG: FAD-containing oxidoreductase [Luteitalea sp.]|nr:FAD-containing oxidoreductase [Luteitalea sp.]
MRGVSERQTLGYRAPADGVGTAVEPASLDFTEFGLLPADPHDRQLVDNVHPSDWINPTPRRRYNLVVVGAGTAGLVTAAGASALGARVALVEQHLMGGDCLNYGCVPSKALLHVARTAHDVKRAARLGVRSSEDVRVDFAVAMDRLRRLRAHLAPHDSARRFSDLGVDVYLGKASFCGRNAVMVGDQRLTFSRAVIATGARAAALPVTGLTEVGYLTNETLFGLTTLPRRLLVIGAGPIGCEMAQAFASFGSRVTIISLDRQLLPREDPDVAAFLHRRFIQDGIALCLGARLTRVARGPNGKHVGFNRGQGEEGVEADEILLAVGREPNVAGLELAAAGVELAQGGVRVDDRLRTTNRRIYAAGDVCSAWKFTHAADAMARIVLQNALFFGRKKARALVIPWCTYTDPEVAHVGLSAQEADEQGFDVRTFDVDLTDIDRAVLDEETNGFARLHTDRHRGRILGATIVARRAGDMIGEITLAMTAGLGAATLSQTIHPYPTQSEVIRRLGDAYRRARLTPSVGRLLKGYFRWLR